MQVYKDGKWVTVTQQKPSLATLLIVSLMSKWGFWYAVGFTMGWFLHP